MSTPIHIISLGNQCAPALAIRDLGYRNVAYPFDWVPTNPLVIYECLNEGFDRYLSMGAPRSFGEINNDLIEFQNIDAPRFPKSHINEYNCWFVHDTGISTKELKEQYLRRIERLHDTIKSGDQILFLFSNECAVYSKTYREKEELYYLYLQKIENILIEKYKCTNFKILSIFTNATFCDTEHIHCVNMNWRGEYSDKFELHIGRIWGVYRDNVKNILKNYLQTLSV